MDSNELNELRQKSASGNKKAYGQLLEYLADLLESGGAPPAWLLATGTRLLRAHALGIRLKKAAGRPVLKVGGSGLAQAREYVELVYGSGMGKTAAARKIATEWNSSISTVFRNVKRHEEKLIAEIDAETKAIRDKTIEIQRAISLDSGASHCLGVLSEAIRGKE